MCVYFNSFTKRQRYKPYLLGVCWKMFKACARLLVTAHLNIQDNGMEECVHARAMFVCVCLMPNATKPLHRGALPSKHLAASLVATIRLPLLLLLLLGCWVRLDRRKDILINIYTSFFTVSSDGVVRPEWRTCASRIYTATLIMLGRVCLGVCFRDRLSRNVTWYSFTK